MAKGSTSDAIVVGPTPLARVTWWLGLPVGGGLAALAVTVGGDWLEGIPFLPWVFNASAAWLESIVGRIPGDVPAPALATGIGTLAGLGVGAYSEYHTTKISVGSDGLRFASDDAETWVERADVRTVYVEDDTVVVLGRRTEVTFLGSSEDLQVSALVDALSHHGYRWHEDDPHAAEYRRWVPGLPGLPDGADAVFAARQDALEEEDVEELDSLRDELGRLGVVVRDESERQHWRLITPER